jgi:hypothetical protein
MNQLLINFFDNTIPLKDDYVNIFKPCENISYVRPAKYEWDGITVFTDMLILNENLLKSVKSKWKIAWLLEPPQIFPHTYQNIVNFEDYFDFIYTYDERLLIRGEKYKKMYFGSCWITEEFCKIHDKSKMVSMVASNKRLTDGHNFRHEIISKLHNTYNFDLWGSGYNYFEHTEEKIAGRFKDYRYSIVVENGRLNNYFTEKIIDCFATGTIPIYWGDPKIKDIFDERGFYTFSTIGELEDILNNKISIDDYNSKIDFIKNNFELHKKYESPDKWMYENCYKQLK